MQTSTVDNFAREKIRISDRVGAESLRQRLISYLWKGSLPARKATLNIGPPNTAWPSLLRVDRCFVDLPHGFGAEFQVFRNQTPNNGLVIYHQGHDGSFYVGEKHIKALLAEGYTVIGLTMPLYEPNWWPAAVGSVAFTRGRHDAFALLETDSFAPLSLCLEPAIVALNTVMPEGPWREVGVLGYSGGGWTAMMLAALDTRITRSYPVAGTMPQWLKTEPPNDANYSYGDWEQNVPRFYRLVDTLELYALAADRPGRRQIQILGVKDPVCFAGRTAAAYESAVSSTARSLGGSWSLMLDDTHDYHGISPAGMAAILTDLGG